MKNEFLCHHFNSQFFQLFLKNLIPQRWSSITALNQPSHEHKQDAISNLFQSVIFPIYLMIDVEISIVHINLVYSVLVNSEINIICDKQHQLYRNFDCKTYSFQLSILYGWAFYLLYYNDKLNCLFNLNDW